LSTPLFECPTLELTNAAEPKIVTPLGTLSLDAEIDGVLLGDLKPSAAYRLEHDGHLFSWTLDGFIAELLLCRPHLSLRADRAVEGCWAGMWRVRVSVPAEASSKKFWKALTMLEPLGIIRTL
jgi:hypothetical protein